MPILVGRYEYITIRLSAVRIAVQQYYNSHPLSFFLLLPQVWQGQRFWRWLHRGWHQRWLMAWCGAQHWQRVWRRHWRWPIASWQARHRWRCWRWHKRWCTAGIKVEAAEPKQTATKFCPLSHRKLIMGLPRRFISLVSVGRTSSLHYYYSASVVLTYPSTSS
jgi:hypothetical protein